jgi:hypothetical protein
MNLTESLKEAEKEFELGGSYFKFEEGARFRCQLTISSNLWR